MNRYLLDTNIFVGIVQGAAWAINIHTSNYSKGYLIIQRNNLIKDSYSENTITMRISHTNS